MGSLVQAHPEAQGPLRESLSVSKPVGFIYKTLRARVLSRVGLRVQFV